MKAIIVNTNFPDNDPEKSVFAAAGWDVSVQPDDSPDQLKQAGQEADALLVQFSIISKEIMEQWTKCKLIVRYGIGYDNVDVEAASALGIQVCNVSGYCLDEVADHASALILAASRKLFQAHRSIEQGIWSVGAVQPLPKLEHTLVGIVGFGRIGERVVQRLTPFRFQIHVYDPYLSADAAREKGIDKEDDLKRLLQQADIVSLHLPLLPQTYHLLDEEKLGWMKPTASIVNTSRGALIDTVALADALKRRTIGFAALDVVEQEPLPDDHPLRSCGHTLLTPHIAYYSDSSLLELQRMAAEEAVRFGKGEPLNSPVNRIPPAATLEGR